MNGDYINAIGISSESNHHRRLPVVFWICGLYALKTEDAKLLVDSYAHKLYPNFSSEVQEIPILNLNSPRSHLSPINSVEGDRSHNGSMNNIDS